MQEQIQAFLEYLEVERMFSGNTIAARSEERRVGKECYVCGVDLGGRRIIQAEDGIRDLF